MCVVVFHIFVSFVAEVFLDTVRLYLTAAANCQCLLTPVGSDCERRSCRLAHGHAGEIASIPEACTLEFPEEKCHTRCGTLGPAGGADVAHDRLFEGGVRR